MAAELVIFICTTILFLILWIIERTKNARKFKPQKTTPYPQQTLDPYTGKPYHPQPYQQSQPNPYYRQPDCPPPQYAPQTPPQQFVQPPVQPQFAPPPSPPVQQEQQPQYAQAQPYAQQPLNPYNSGSYYQGPQIAPKAPLSKEAAHLRNLNIILFIASVLVLAGAAVIIGSMSDASTRLIILLAITAVFYISGIVIHIVTERLRPAALALTSTGLALIPFTGIAFYYFANFSGPTAWLIMSAIGLVANIIATYVLRNQVVTYIAIAFVFSLLCSLVTTAAVGMIWYFAILILVSMICSLINLFKPTLLPEIFVKPIERTGLFVTPAAVVCSLCLIGNPAAVAPLYSVVFTLAAVHYLIAFLRTKKALFEMALRIMAQLAVICIVADIFAIEPHLNMFLPPMPLEHQYILALTIFVTAALQMIVSLIKIKLNNTAATYTMQLPWIICASIVALMSTFALFPFGFPYGIKTAVPIAVFITFLFVGLYYGYVAVFLKKVSFAYASLVCSIVVFFALLRGVIDPHTPLYFLPLPFFALSIIVLFYYKKQHTLRSKSVRIFLKTALLSYLGLTLLTTILPGPILSIKPDQEWVIPFFAIMIIVCAILLQRLSTIEKNPIYMIFACITLYYGIGVLFFDVNFNFVLLASVRFAVFGIVTIIFHRRGESAYRNITFIATSASVLALLYAVYPPFSQLLIVYPAAQMTSAIVAAIMALFVAIAGLIIGNSDKVFKRIAVTSSLIICFISAMIATQVGEALCACLFIYLAALAYLFSVRFNIQWLVLIAIPSLMTALFLVPIDFAKSYLEAYFVFGIIAAVSYILYLLNLRFAPDNKFRENTLFAFALFYLLLTSVVPVGLESPLGYLSATALLTMGVIIFIRGHMNEREHILRETGLYVSAGACIWFMAIYTNSAYNIIFGAHIAAAFVCLAAMLFTKESSSRFHRLAVAATITAAGTGIQALITMDTLPVNNAACFAMFLYFAALVYLFSERFRLPWLLLLSVPSLMGALFFVPWSANSVGFRPELFVLVVTAVVSYFLYMVNVRLRPAESIRTNILYWYSILYLLLAAIAPAIIGFDSGNIWPQIASATALLAIGVLLWVRGRYNDKEKFLIECGLYVGTAAVIGYASIFIPGSFDNIIGAHIAVAAIIVSAFALRKDGTGRLVRLIVAASIVTVGTCAEAIASEMVFFQNLFLGEMLAILLIGAIRNKKWALYWGCGATIASIVYYLRNIIMSYTWLMLIILGILLIAFVIWRLMKINKKKG